MKKGWEVVPHPFDFDFFPIVPLYQSQPTCLDNVSDFIFLAYSSTCRENRQNGGLTTSQQTSKPSAVRQAAGRSACRGGNFQDRSHYLLHRPAKLPRRNHGRRRDQQVIARNSVHASLHGINQQPSPETRLPHEPGEILLLREGSLCLLVSHKFNAAQQSQSADIPHRIQIAQILQSDSQSRPRRPVNLRIGGMHQIQRPHAPQHRAPRSHRNRVRVIGKAMQKSSRPGSDRIDNFLARNHRPQRSVSRGKALRGN
jgi:hypothetical protein